MYILYTVKSVIFVGMKDLLDFSEKVCQRNKGFTVVLHTPILGLFTPWFSRWNL